MIITPFYYSNSSVKLMIDILTDLGLNHPYKFTKYDIENFGHDENLKKIADNLTKKAMSHYQQNKTNKNCFVSSNIINGSQKDIDCNVDIDESLRETLYHDYLHWCSSMKRDPASLLLAYVSVPQINPQTNQFYRTAYQG